MGAKRTIKHTIDGGIIEKETGGLGGSRHMLEITYGRRIANILLDIGGNQLRSDTPISFDPLRNINTSKLDAAIVSHIHQDHNGDIVFLPKGGYKKEIYMTETSKGLTEIITRDNLKTQSELKSLINKRLKEDWDNIRKAVYTVWHHNELKKTRNKKVLPQNLFPIAKAYEIIQANNINIAKIKTEKQLEHLKPQFKSRDFNEHDVAVMLDHITPIPLHKDYTILRDFVKVKFYDAGHVEGSAQTLLKIIGNTYKPKNTFNMLYTGDIGRFKQPGKAGTPEIPTERIDYLVIESTYGDKIHPDRLLEKQRLIEQIHTAKGLVLVPCFAIQRFQEVRELLGEAIEQKELHLYDNEVIYCHSNLAYDISKEYLARDMDNRYEHLRRNPKFKWIQDQDDVRALIGGKGRRIILCSGGMLENGSIMQYLHQATQSKYAKILTTGFQAPGTIGARLSNNDFSQPIIVNDTPIRNNKASMHGFSFSSHGDQDELMHYIKGLKLADAVQIALVHGGVQRYPLAEKIEEYLHQRDLHKRKEHRGKWKIHIPESNGSTVMIKEPPYIHL